MGQRKLQILNHKEMNHDNNNIDTTSKPKRGRTAIWIAVILSLLLAGSIAGSYYLSQDNDLTKAGLKDANSQILELQKQNAKLKIQLDTTMQSLAREKGIRQNLELENDTLRTMFPLYITDMQIGNSDGSGKIVGSFGKEILAENSMFLMPRITYVGLKSGKCELYVKLFDNEGNLVTGSNSPAGFSYSYKFDLELNQHTIQLSGWGGSERGHFLPGTYRFEVWLGDMCLRQKYFVLR